MELLVQREPSSQGATLGSLYVDDVWFSWTLEDEIREVPGEPVEQWKVYGKTAIPACRVRVVMEYSPKFKRMLPELKGVPGFVESKFHAGNDADDTDGCILIGFRRAGAQIVGGTSRPAEDELVRRIEAAIRNGEQVWLTVLNPGAYRKAMAS